MALVDSEIHPQMNYINLLSLIGHEILRWTEILTGSTDRCKATQTLLKIVQSSTSDANYWITPMDTKAYNFDLLHFIIHQYCLYNICMPTRLSVNYSNLLNTNCHAENEMMYIS